MNPSDDERDSKVKFQFSVTEKVQVTEKSVRTKTPHTGAINGIIINAQKEEFITFSEDKSMKIWDDSEEGCFYTYEQEEALNCLESTGEFGDINVMSLGEGNMKVYKNTDQSLQEEIEAAHKSKIIQIISLKRLQDKYFGTRDINGNFCIWLAAYNPDKVYTIESIDREEESYKVSESFENAEDKKEQEKEILYSERDTLIELQDRKLIQASSTMLCSLNHLSSTVTMMVIDMKTKRKNVKGSFQTESKPTCLFQIDANNLIVGTQLGKMEHWTAEEDKDVWQHESSIDAHMGCTDGISQIKYMKTLSKLFYGGEPNFLTQEGKNGEKKQLQQTKLVLTAAIGAPEFRIWKLNTQSAVISPHIRIETTFKEGINYIMEINETKIIAADKKTIKFYDFEDKEEIKQREEEQKRKQYIYDTTKAVFKKYDANKNDRLEYDECKKFIQETIELNLPGTAFDENVFNNIFYMVDTDRSSTISWHEMRKFFHMIQTF